ncbi:unnamed protein product [Closterium sp. Naga37s-1]|nr:unnamed protein product [Closterium sp. Naga37s-1]
MHLLSCICCHASAVADVREDKKLGVFVEGLQEVVVSTAGATYALFKRGSQNRRRKDDAGMMKRRISRFNLVDLAGSERRKHSEAQGLRLKEAGNINKSLIALGNVIKDSLGGNSKCTLLAAVSPAERNVDETMSTLKFAQRAKLMHNEAVVNELILGNPIVMAEEIRRLRLEIAELKENRCTARSITRAQEVARKGKGSKAAEALAEGFVGGAAEVQVRCEEAEANLGELLQQLAACQQAESLARTIAESEKRSSDKERVAGEAAAARREKERVLEEAVEGMRRRRVELEDLRKHMVHELEEQKRGWEKALEGMRQKLVEGKEKEGALGEQKRRLEEELEKMKGKLVEMETSGREERALEEQKRDSEEVLEEMRRKQVEMEAAGKEKGELENRRRALEEALQSEQVPRGAVEAKVCELLQQVAAAQQAGSVLKVKDAQIAALVRDLQACQAELARSAAEKEKEADAAVAGREKEGALEEQRRALEEAVKGRKGKQVELEEKVHALEKEQELLCAAAKRAPPTLAPAHCFLLQRSAGYPADVHPYSVCMQAQVRCEAAEAKVGELLHQLASCQQAEAVRTWELQACRRELTRSADEKQRSAAEAARLRVDLAGVMEEKERAGLVWLSPHFSSFCSLPNAPHASSPSTTPSLLQQMLQRVMADGDRQVEVQWNEAETTGILKEEEVATLRANRRVAKNWWEEFKDEPGVQKVLYWGEFLPPELKILKNVWARNWGDGGSSNN